MSPLPACQKCPIAAVHHCPRFGYQALCSPPEGGGFPFSATSDSHAGIYPLQGKLVAGQRARIRDRHQIEDIAKQLEPLPLECCGVRGFMKMWILPFLRYSIEAGGSPVPDHSHVVARYHAGQRRCGPVCEQAYPVQSLAMAQDHIIPEHQLLPRQDIRP